MDKIQDEIIEEFSVFDDWLDKFAPLLGLRCRGPTMDHQKDTS